jgi:hypothetical protein
LQGNKGGNVVGARLNQGSKGDMVTEESETWPGWTLADALERTADPDLWKSWLETWPETYQDLNALIVESPPTPVLKDHLWEHFTTGRLVVTGVGDRGGDPSVLDAATLKAYNVPDWSGSIVRSDKNAQIDEVRVFPVVRSPGAAKRVIGLSLVQAFRQLVLEDPEVVALSKPLTRYVRVFKEGSFPGGAVSYLWPLDLTADGCAYQFVSSFGGFVGDALPSASKEQSAVSVALVDRLQALRGLLATGKVLARGTSARTDTAVVIPALEWSRSNVSIDVENGDFCEIENYTAKIRWSSISLEAPEKRDTPPRDLLRPTTPAKEKSAAVPPKNANAAKLTPTEARVRTAIGAIFPDGFPDGLSAKGRNKQIIDWVKKNGPQPVSAKSINRYVSKFIS